ncbi:MAG: carbohydrate ABC transporter permease [Spirochaetia bacterium]
MAMNKQTRMLLEKVTPYLFLALPMLIYFVWVIGPTLYSFYLSLTNWDGFSAPEFIGLANFERLFRDPVFFISLQNNLVWILCFITIPVVLGLFVAMALNNAIPLGKVFKASFYSPMILSLVVCGLIWSWLYHPASGLINSVLRAIGLGNLAQGWLSNSDIVLGAIITVAIWRQVGYVMILYLAGLQGVDPSLVDASRVDGASSRQVFWHIILPQLAPITVIVIVISIIDSLRAFDLVNVMTRGGPHNSSSVLANFMYIEAFNNYKMGYGAAIAVVLFFISLVFIAIYLRHVMKEEAEG